MFNWGEYPCLICSLAQPKSQIERIPFMENPSNEVIFYIAITSEMNWGRGETILEALTNARALSKGRWKRVKSRTSPRWDGASYPFEVVLHKNTQTDDDLLTEEKLEGCRKAYIRLTGYSVGDRLKPFVGDYGQTVGYGKWEQIEIPAEFLPKAKRLTDEELLPEFCL
jgi:hypothetical protein